MKKLIIKIVIKTTLLSYTLYLRYETLLVKYKWIISEKFKNTLIVIIV